MMLLLSEFERAYDKAYDEVLKNIQGSVKSSSFLNQEDDELDFDLSLN